MRKFRPLSRPRLLTIYKEKTIPKNAVGKYMEHDFFGRSSGKFPGRSNRTFQKVVLERPKKAVPNVFHFFKTIFNLFLIPVSRVGQQGGGDGIPVYPKKIRQNTPNSGSEINFLIWAPTGEQV